MPTRPAGSHSRRLGAERGTSAIEFALFAPLLAMIVVSVVEIGFAIRQQMQAQDAAAAGALYAAKNGWDLAAIEAAVANAKPGSGLVATPSPVLFCGCPTSTQVVATTCGTTCVDGSTARSYVRVSASASRQSFVVTDLPLPATITASATMRLP